jgi:ABC-type molybdate transport system substrate-binding protein
MENQNESAVNTAKIQRGKPFEKGASGNPNGRPKGSRNKTTMAMMEILDEEAEAITHTVINQAKKGDMMAIKLIMERLCPPRKDSHITFNLRNVTKLDDLIPATNQLLQAVSSGELTPQEAQMIAALIEQQRKTIISTLPLIPLDDL